MNHAAFYPPLNGGRYHLDTGVWHAYALCNPRLTLDRNVDPMFTDLRGDEHHVVLCNRCIAKAKSEPTLFED